MLVHIGAGEWVCVDSCLDRETRKPVALQYLSRIGVNPSTAVALIVVTHWHQDHMKGVSKILEAATNALFACSGALKSADFMTAIAASEEHRHREQGLFELAQALEILEQRRPPGVAPGSASPQWALEGHVFLNLPDRVPSVVLRALSPSHGARLIGMRELSSFLPKARQPKRRPVPLGPNQQSVAMWIEVGDVKVLLGGDLENSSDAGIGWRAVLAAPSLPGGRAGLFKVPHHGSGNADHPDVWGVKLEDPPLAVLAPYASASRPVPNDADQRRLASRTLRAYCTANPRGSKPSFSDRVVARKMRTTPLRAREVTGRTGHIRVRRRFGETGLPRVELFSGAFHITG